MIEKKRAREAFYVFLRTCVVYIQLSVLNLVPFEQLASPDFTSKLLLFAFQLKRSSSEVAMDFTRLSTASVIIASRRIKVSLLVSSSAFTLSFGNFLKVRRYFSDENKWSIVRNGRTACLSDSLPTEKGSWHNPSLHRDKSLS